MRCLTLLILIMTGLMDLFRRRPVWAGASAPPGTGPASDRAPKLRRDAGTPGPGRMAVPCRNAAHRRTRQRRRSVPVHANAFETPPCAPGAGPYHHSVRPGGLAPTGLCTATRNACSAIQNRAERVIYGSEGLVIFDHPAEYALARLRMRGFSSAFRFTLSQIAQAGTAARDSGPGVVLVPAQQFPAAASRTGYRRPPAPA